MCLRTPAALAAALAAMMSWCCCTAMGRPCRLGSRSASTCRGAARRAHSRQAWDCHTPGRRHTAQHAAPHDESRKRNAAGAQRRRALAWQKKASASTASTTCCCCCCCCIELWNPFVFVCPRAPTMCTSSQLRHSPASEVSNVSHAMRNHRVPKSLVLWAWRSSGGCPTSAAHGVPDAAAAAMRAASQAAQHELVTASSSGPAAASWAPRGSRGWGVSQLWSPSRDQIAASSAALATLRQQQRRLWHALEAPQRHGAGALLPLQAAPRACGVLLRPAAQQQCWQAQLRAMSVQKVCAALHVSWWLLSLRPSRRHHLPSRRDCGRSRSRAGAARRPSPCKGSSWP